MEEERLSAGQCWNSYAGPQVITVHQVLGNVTTQKSMDIHIVVPKQKPAIEQIIDVFVKQLRIVSVDVIPNKVIVQGEFEVKGIYVACRPRHGVHAAEVRHIRFTAYAHIPGARPGMEADAGVEVEFVDYECDEHTRAHWYKNYDGCWDDSHYCHDEDEEEEECDYPKPPKPKCKPKCKPDPCKCKKPKKCTREFDVSVVLQVTAKVFSDRDLVWNSGMPVVPIKPKG